jgi:outer membrane protein TolC
VRGLSPDNPRSEIRPGQRSFAKNFLIAKARALRRPVFLYPMKKQRLFAALPLLLAGLWATVSAADNITTPEQLFPQLDGILKQAVAQSPGMISRAIDLEMAEDARISARAGILPSIGGYYSYYEAQDDRADLNGRFSVTKVAYNFSLNQPLYHWGERRNNARMGEIRQSISQGQYRDGYRKLAQEVRSQYFRLIISKVRAQKAVFYAEFTARQLQQGELRLAKKVVSEAQMFSIRMENERAQISVERTNFDFENDKITFSRLTGLPLLRDDEIPASIPAAATQDQAVQQVLSGFLAQKDPPSTEAETFRKSLEIEQLNLANTKTRLRPKFNAVIGISQDEQSYSVNVAQKYQVNSYYGGISLNWSIFDGFSTGAAVRSSLNRVRQMQQDYRSLTERLAQQAQTQARLAGFYARYASINDRYLISGEGNLRSKKEEFARGVISEEDVSGAQLGLFDSQINAYSSRADYYNQLCEFLGTVMEDPVLGNLAAK